MKAKFKKNQLIIEDCGCSYRILSVSTKKEWYKVQHLVDKDIRAWDITDCEQHCVAKD